MATAECPHCGGSGWKTVEKDGLSGAERGECFFEHRSQRSEERACIPPNYANASFDNFMLPQDNHIARRSLADSLVIVRSYTREFPHGDKPGLLFLGDPGTGKTHLAVAAMRSLIARGFEGLFYDYQSLLERIRSSYDSASQISDKAAYRNALDAEILLLDDLGAQRITDWTEDTVTSIITHRCNNKKPLIATTNLIDPDAGGVVIERTPGSGKVDYKITLAERIGARARSRLFEMCRIVRMPQVQDYRVKTSR